VIWVAVAVAGALGAAARYLVDHLVSARVSGVFPWGTLVINVSGSLAAGVTLGLVASHGLPDGVGTVVAGGFIGAYTTFSTAMYETARLVEDGATPHAIANLTIPLVASALAATLGYVLVAS
jgi:CrcB protein